MGATIQNFDSCRLEEKKRKGLVSLEMILFLGERISPEVLDVDNNVELTRSTPYERTTAHLCVELSWNPTASRP
ncbi:hypothetical protein J1N35_033534 [Gossypium stocksii]|uniref:Uncharacterized protein n=1 Tax=Gossypium stocksii TaxID=47602 RepID=A0A9D3UR58_9ROSI|nr:hypothetical protein J1N35_033534 [Gossypium stocksii]